MSIASISRIAGFALAIWCFIFFAKTKLRQEYPESTMVPERFSGAASDISSIQYLCHLREPFTLPVTQEQWRLFLDDLAEQQGSTVDPWGNEYQFVESKLLEERESFIHGEGSGICRLAGVGVYSLGKDGVSETNGDDPDDINFWARTDYSSYYRSLANSHFEAERSRAATSTSIAWLIWVVACLPIWLAERKRCTK
jgi:hypothetical protein